MAERIPLFTTNYDSFIEQAMMRFGVDAEAMYDMSNGKLVHEDHLSVQARFT